MKIPRLGARALTGVLLALTLGVTALAGCTAAPQGGIPSAGAPSAGPGSSAGPNTPGSSSPESSAPQTPASPDAYAYASCMRDHGIEMSDPDPKTGLQTVGDSVDPESAAFKAAHDACGHLLPGGFRGEPKETDADAYLKFAQCMRENGMPDFPDPQPGSGEGMFPGVDRNDPAFAEAAKACQDILSGADQ